MRETERSLQERNSIWKELSVKVEVEDMEDLLGPEDVDVDFRRILKEARDERERKIFETFSSEGLNDFLVAEWSRWDKYKRAPWRQDSSASASEGWWREDQEQLRKRVMDTAEDYLEHCAQVKVDIEVVESLLKPENVEVSLRCTLKYSTRGGSNIFQLFDTLEKPNNFAASRRRWLENQRKKLCTARRWARRVA